MALFAAARRAATSTLPLLRPLAAAAARPQPRSMPFSSSAPLTKPAFDSELVRVIDNAIKDAEEESDDDQDRDKEITFYPKINDGKGSNAITLTRTYHGEDIELELSMDSLVTDNEPETVKVKFKNEERWSSDESEYEEVQLPPKSSIPLTVTISKGDRPILVFSCSAYPEEIVIDTLALMRPLEDKLDQTITYEVPDFDDLDERLQKALYKYLELRRITPTAVNLIQEYMISKGRGGYPLWLRKLKDFVSRECSGSSR